MINKILRNETYIGTLIQGKHKKLIRKQKKMIKTNFDEWKISKNHHEAIIEKEKFDIVQKILDFSHIVQDDDEFLISKLKCAECNNGFYRKKSKGYYYYICKSRYRKLGCELQPIRKDILENMVLIDLNDKYKINKKSINKEIVEYYIENIEISNPNIIKIVYRN